MRGKDTQARLLHFVKRITPAYAGKSIDGFCDFFDIQDHPCVCGEKRISSGLTDIDQGSPLRMRGKVIPVVILCDDAGITPAYAGKSPTD